MAQVARIPVWHPGLSVGNALLDKHHILLMALAQSLADDAGRLDAQALCSAVEDILELARRHCAAEEHLLVLNGYEWADQHREEHAAGLHRIRTVLDEAACGAVSHDDVANAVVDWLAAHATDMDLPARDYLRHDTGVDRNQPDPLGAHRM